MPLHKRDLTAIFAVLTFIASVICIGMAITNLGLEAKIEMLEVELAARAEASYEVHTSIATVKMTRDGDIQLVEFEGPIDIRTEVVDGVYEEEAELTSWQSNIVDPEPTTPLYHVVRPGDWLSKMAKWYLGDASRWPEIYELNRDTIEDPDLIYPGQTVRIW